MGEPIINIWGTHYRTDVGRCHRRTFQPLLRPIIVQMGDAAIDTLPSPSCVPLSYRWGMHYYPNGGCPLSYKWGMIITQMGDALLPKWGMIITQIRDDYYPN